MDSGMEFNGQPGQPTKQEIEVTFRILEKSLGNLDKNEMDGQKSGHHNDLLGSILSFITEDVQENDTVFGITSK